MQKLLGKLWNDDCGALISMELLFVATLLVIGLIVGLTNLRNAIVTQLTVLGNAILELDLSYSFGGLSGCCSATSGTQAIDIPTLLTPPVCVPGTVSVISVPVPCT